MKARRRWAWPLVPLYAAGLAVKDGLRRVGVLPTGRLKSPVVCVGSLSAGGAGKTPVVIALANLLRERGWDVDVLSRGYGRSGTGVERVDPEAANAARRFGDEPVLLARGLELPVWVGSDRFAAGEAAERDEASEQEADSSAALRNDKEFALPNDKQVALRADQRRVHLLDDGFQHRRLARAVDVVLVTEEDLEDALLPAGNRRERLASLRRADVVVLRDEERARLETRVRGLMSQNAMVWSVRRELRFPDPASRPGAVSTLVGFCAIARPEGFWATLAEAGCKVAERVEFGDHHVYEALDVERLVKVARGAGATGFVTTEKDAVKLSGAMLGRLRSVGPVCVARLDAKFVDQAKVVRELEARLR